MGLRFRPAAPHGATKKRIQAFDSTVFGFSSQTNSTLTPDLNKLALFPQLLNLEQTCNNPHLHSLARTVIRTRLSAWACQPFCCQRTFYPSRSECPECLRTCLEGLSGPRYAILPSSSAPVFWDFASCFSCPATRFGNPLRELLPLATAPNHCRKIKNPASSAGRNHPHLSGSTRCSTSFYPVLVKNPTIGSTSRLRFFSGWKTSRSDCDAPERSLTLCGPRTIRNDISFS
jgi:hypothetical protein